MLSLALALALVQAAAPVFIDGTALKTRAARPGVVIVQTGERAAFDAGHIPNARFADLGDFHSHAQTDQLPPASSLEAAVRRLGVSNQDEVVIVADPMLAGLLYVAFDYLGHGGRTRVLDGGLAAWRDAGGTLTTETTTAPPSAFVGRPRTDMIVDAAWVRARLDQPSVALLDARSRPEYLGTTSAEQLPRAGHIPGAAHFEWHTALLSAPGRPAGRDLDGPDVSAARLRPLAEIDAMFRRAGAAPGDTVVAYCTVGMRASYLYLVARASGRQAKLYVGSMADWSRRSDLPVAGPGQ